MPFIFVALESGAVSVIFSSPEALKTGHWLNVIQKFTKQVCVLTYDEGQALVEWYVVSGHMIRLFKLRFRFSLHGCFHIIFKEKINFYFTHNEPMLWFVGIYALLLGNMGLYRKLGH